MTQEGQDNLLDFNWEAEGDDFFISPSENKNDKVEKEKIKEDLLDTETKEEEDFFKEFEGDSLKTEESSKEKENTAQGSIYNDVFKDLKEQGILKHVEIDENEELDADKLFELQQEEYEKEVEARIMSWADEMDEDAKEFLKFKSKGGKTEDFLKTYQSSTELPIGDIEDEDHQDRVVRYQLKKEGWDSEEIEDRLRYLTDSGKKEAAAEKYYKKIKAEDEQNKKKLLEQTEAQKQKVLEKEKEFKSEIREMLNNTNEIKGVKVTDKEKTDLFNFMTKKSYKISNDRFITGFQKKLSEALQDSDKMVLLAKLVSSDFDMKDFEKKIITKKTREIKSNLEQRKNIRPNSFGSSLKGKSLADLLE